MQASFPMIVGLQAYAGALRLEDNSEGRYWEVGRHNTKAGTWAPVR
jgi:hypothetical protein